MNDATFYRELYRIRHVELEVARVYPSDKIKSPVHLSIGQESVSVGVCQALRNDDIVFGTYRGHALYVAKGGDLRAMIAELYGKHTGCAKGKGGSMHLIDVRAGMMGASAVVSTTIPLAVGYAQALRMRRSDAVVASFFGDGATEEGVFHESLNFAALKKLPVLFVCENNVYAIHSRQSDRQAKSNLTERAATYGIRSERVEDGDVTNIHRRAHDLVQAIRRGEGPQFLECDTYRWAEHVGPGDDFAAGYRSRSEIEAWIERDSVRVVGARLDADTRARIEREVHAEVQDAFAFAEASPFPDRDELLADVYAGPG
jgi:TPP-dependent pyruvate/acetoin dehydrogenase alpha subunit